MKRFVFAVFLLCFAAAGCASSSGQKTPLEKAVDTVEKTDQWIRENMW